MCNARISSCPFPFVLYESCFEYHPYGADVGPGPLLTFLSFAVTFACYRFLRNENEKSSWNAKFYLEEEWLKYPKTIVVPECETSIGVSLNVSLKEELCTDGTLCVCRGESRRSLGSASSCRCRFWAHLPSGVLRYDDELTWDVGQASLS